MFGNLKDLHKLQSQAREIQNKLKSTTVEAEKSGIKIIMDGNQKVISVTLNPQLNQEDQEKYLAEAINDALKKVQNLMAQHMLNM